MVACVAGHLDRLLLGVSYGKDTKSAAKSNSLPSERRPCDLNSVYWTPGPTWKSPDRNAEEDTQFEQTKWCKTTSELLQNNFNNI